MQGSNKHTPVFRTNQLPLVRNVRLALFALSVLILVNVPAMGAPKITEGKLKALWVMNLIRFVEWPNLPQKGEFHIAVIGDGAISDHLKGYGGQTVLGNTIHVHVTKTLNETHDISKYSLVFVCKTTKEKLKAHLKRFMAHSILTVGEQEEFLDHGGMINFFLSKQRLKYEVSQKKAFLMKLRINSLFLARAERVVKK